MYTLSYIKKNKFFICVGGISGIGKTTLITRLIEKYSEIFSVPYSCTSRERRSEYDNEYLHLNKEEIIRKYLNNELLNIHEVYGNYYGILKSSYDEITSKGLIPIKEIHPSNFDDLSERVNTIKILIENKNKSYSSIPFETRLDRVEDDKLWNEKYDFDLILNINGLNPEQAVDYLFSKLVSFEYQIKKYNVSSFEIDKINKQGYNSIASEFIDDKRVTTKNFHDISIEFWKKNSSALKSARQDGNILEIGPGNGWLLSNFEDEFDVTSFDISTQMLNNYKNSFIGSARNMPFPACSFKVIISSLGDPFLFPEALIEIDRVLKPNGIFIVTYPSIEWAKNMPSRNDTFKTKFKTQNGDDIIVFSFCDVLTDICNIPLKMSVSVIDNLYIDDTYTDYISPAISASINNSKTSRLSILTGLIFTK